MRLSEDVVEAMIEAVAIVIVIAIVIIFLCVVYVLSEVP